MSHTDEWKQAFNDSAGEVLPQYKQQCNHVEVLNDIALSLNMNEKKGCNQDLGARAAHGPWLEKCLGKGCGVDIAHADH